MALDISLATVGVSASVSIVTSYFGTLINFSRLRNRHRRVLGLSLLAEIKMLQRRIRYHYHLFEAGPGALPKPTPRLSVGTADTSVFSNGSGNLGLFATRTAVEVLEYYSTIRVLAAQAEALGGIVTSEDDTSGLRDAIAEHLRAIRLARHHSRLVVIALRRDIPMTTEEMLRHGMRRMAIAIRRARRRIGRLHRLRQRRVDDWQTADAALSQSTMRPESCADVSSSNHSESQPDSIRAAITMTAFASLPTVTQS